MYLSNGEAVISVEYNFDCFVEYRIGEGGWKFSLSRFEISKEMVSNFNGFD
jgi:hypothetical protein